MTIDAYDVSRAPDAAEWLQLDEAARIALVAEAHRRTRGSVGGNEEAHASIHVVVEDRLAMGHAAVVTAYERCRAAGVDRHNAIHALASVVTNHMVAVLESQAGFDQATADQDFESIDPEKWKRKLLRP
jgi:hypothetical protein